MGKYKVIYVAGPYRANCEDDVWDNIMAARHWAKMIWMAGGVALCPHLNTMLMGGRISEDNFIDGDLELVARCDAVVMISTWQASEGALKEKAFAESIGLPVFTTMAQVRDFIKGGE